MKWRKGHKRQEAFECGRKEPKMRKMQEAQGLDQLIEAGSAGFFPLFYQDWIHESFADVSEVRKISFSMAAENV
jgi:hypothetical protein